LFEGIRARMLEVQEADVGAQTALRAVPPFRVTGYYIAPWSWAGDENGLVASTTNRMSALSSVVPLLKTSIGMPAECPFIVWPAST
jgi:hypothetical protein